jgi:hypothetical protein
MDNVQVSVEYVEMSGEAYVVEKVGFQVLRIDFGQGCSLVYFVVEAPFILGRNHGAYWER